MDGITEFRKFAAQQASQASKKWRSALSLAFSLLVVGVIVYAARKVQWREIPPALLQIRPGRLAIAATLASVSYAVYAFTDLFAYPYFRGRVSRPGAIVIAFVSYAFNESFGSLLGTIGFRFRLYARYGVEAGSIARIVGMSFVTNWSGYCLLAGIAFTANSLPLPQGWEIGQHGLRAVGVVLLLVAAGYPVLCAAAAKLRRHFALGSFELPDWKMAISQIALSTGVWLAVAGSVYALFQGRVEATTVLAVFLLASVAGLISHVPGGLGVIEAVFLALLGSRLPANQILAALIAYRVVYYLWPLLPAALLYLWLERTAPKKLS